MSEVYYEVRMTRVLHTVRISNVDRVMFVDRNKRDYKFLSSVKKLRKMFFFSSCHERYSFQTQVISN